MWENKYRRHQNKNGLTEIELERTRGSFPRKLEWRYHKMATLGQKKEHVEATAEVVRWNQNNGQAKLVHAAQTKELWKNIREAYIEKIENV